MALSTYTELKAAVADYAVRTDLTTQIVDFIQMAETMFNYGDDENGFPPLRCREMEDIQTDTPSSGSITLQTDFLEMRRVVYTSNPNRVLQYATPEWINEAYPTTDAGDPSFYTIIGESMIIRPVGSSDVTHVYYQKIPAMASNATNWLLSASPNAYVFGALYHLYLFTQNYEAAAGMLTLCKRACGALVGSDKMARAGSYVMRASSPAW